MNRHVITIRKQPIARRVALRVIACLIALAALAQPMQASWGPEPTKEVQIRAAFLLNFVKFSEWPEEAFADEDAAFVVAVVGPDPFGRILEQTFASLKVQDRKVIIHRCPLPDRSRYESSEDFEKAMAQMRQRMAAAHIAYITICAPDQLDLVFKGVDTSRLLTVGSEQRCAVNRTALALDREGDRLVFYANVDILKALEVRVSSKVLSLAKRVESKTSLGGGS